MSDRKKTDVFTELAHDALDARHNGTPFERAEVSHAGRVEGWSFLI